MTKLIPAYGNDFAFPADFGPLFASNAAAALGRRVGTNGILDMHCSNNLEVVQLIGSVTALDRSPGGLLASGGGNGFLHSNDAVEVNVVEQGQAVGICLDVAATIGKPQAYLQVYTLSFLQFMPALCPDPHNNHNRQIISLPRNNLLMLSKISED